MYRLNRRSLHFQWIDRAAIPIKPEVEVRTGGQAGAAHIPDHITLLYINTLSDALPVTTKMHVGG